MGVVIVGNNMRAAVLEKDCSWVFLVCTVIMSLLFGEAAAACPHFVKQIYVKETGGWRNNWIMNPIESPDITDITIDQDNPIGQYFTVKQTGNKWELQYEEPGLTDWYDKPDPGTSTTYIKFTYTCSGNQEIDEVRFFPVYFQHTRCHKKWKIPRKGLKIEIYDLN